MLTAVFVGGLAGVVVYLIAYNTPGFGELGSASTALLLALVAGSGYWWYTENYAGNGTGTYEITHVKSENTFSEKVGEAFFGNGLVKIGQDYIYLKGERPGNGEPVKFKEKILYKEEYEDGFKYETTEDEYRFINKNGMKKLVKGSETQLVLSDTQEGISQDEYLEISERKENEHGKETAKADARNILVTIIGNMAN